MDHIANNSENAIVYSEGRESFLWEIKSYLFKCNESGEIDEVSDHLLRFTPDYYPDQYDYRAADWLFVLNTMNFALWNPKGTKQWTVKELTGYQALCAAIKRAIDNGRPIWNPEYYTKLKRCDLEVIFKSDDEETIIPFIDERLEILREVGTVLLKKFQGSFMQCIQLSDRKPIKLLRLIVNEFESYKDEPLYSDKKVCLYIKAQILLSDIWFCFKRHELGLDFDSNMINSMISSIYIDYRVSQILCHFQILKYNTSLMNKLKNNELLMYGSSEEIEIRSCSISIIKSLAEEIERTYRDWRMEDISEKEINCFVLIVNFLWDYRQAYDQLLMETQPFPYIQCMYY